MNGISKILLITISLQNCKIYLYRNRNQFSTKILFILFRILKQVKRICQINDIYPIEYKTSKR